MYFSIIFIYNIINGRINCTFLTNLLKLYVPPRNLRNNRLFECTTHFTNYGDNEPIARCVRLCNTYSNIIDFGLNINEFKLNLFMQFN